MVKDMFLLHMNQRQFDYLSNAEFLGDPLHQLLRSTAMDARGSSRVLHLTPSQCEALREALTARLCFAGFDKDYEPTAEGRLLEELIDAILESSADGT